MCPPVNVGRGAKGMSCLYEEWLYQLVHGDQMKICFACFKAAFHANRRLLEMEYLEGLPLQDMSQELSEEESQPKDSEEESGPGEWSGQICAGCLEYMSDATSEHSTPSFLSPDSVGSNLEPEEAVPLDPGPEDTDWNQALPWRLGSFYPCPHQSIIPPLSLWDVFNVDPYPKQPVLLELSPLWPTYSGVESWLRKLDFNLVLFGWGTACYLRSMTPLWVVRTQVNLWQVLLDPESLIRAHLETVPRNLDLERYRLSVLEYSLSGVGLELVPADCTLRKGGFKVHSYLPWHTDTPEEWSREPEERLIVNDIVILDD